MLLIPGGRNICASVNHSHSEFNYCLAFCCSLHVTTMSYKQAIHCQAESYFG